MARQSRRLRDPGSRGGSDPLGQRIVLECGRTAAIRDGPAALRPRLPTALPGTLMIAAGPGEWRAALLEDSAPVELFIERGDGSEAGSIHLGRVRRLLPALDAMLVDIGTDRPAFLPASEIWPRKRRLDEGERVIVQIRREAQGGKAARLTTGVLLRGRLVELRLGRPGIRDGGTLSPAERADLSGVVGEHASGVRLAQPAPIEALIAEAAELSRRVR